MSRTVTALYDTREEAEAARQRLSAAVDVESVRIIDNDSADGGQGRGSSSLRNLNLTNDDRHAFGEGLRRGGVMLCAEVDSDEDTDKIIAILEETPSVDLDDRQQSWRSEGWAPYDGSSEATRSSGAYQGQATAFGGDNRNVVEEERIPIVEEELKVGKREVARGGARVRSYITETPVHEQVSLREEHVSIERRPVNETLARGSDFDSDLLRERTVEMTETAEEAVVAKEARVREELVVKKTAEERVEQIDDTIRRTEVEVDESLRGAGDRPAFGGLGSGGSQRSAEESSQRDFERTERDKGGL